MSNYLVSNTDLESVANAIRTKGGTSAQLAFPSDFVSAINSIPTGGGSEMKTLISHVTISENVANVGISDVSYENILILTRGLKTATSSCGALISITGSLGTVSNQVLYDSNVIAAITKQSGICRIEDLSDGYKNCVHTRKPTMNTENATFAMSIDNGVGNPILLGTISAVTISTSNPSYPFTGGDVWFYGW